jgi:hypothetical protein
MVSRIDIGPDGGPYVAINENNNDLELQDINGNVIAKWDETEGQWDLNNNSLTNIDAIDASSATLGSVDTGNLNNIYYASDDVALDTAISEASSEDIIQLSEGDYTKDRTISKSLVFRGSAVSARGSRVSASWTIDGGASFFNISGDANTDLTINSTCRISGSGLFGSSSVDVDDDNFIYTSNIGGSITFASGTSGGIVDGCANTVVTDNGSNTVGDIS